MIDLVQELNERIKALAGDWSKYTVVGSFLLYVAGYLALRFHLTAIGIGTDLAVLDERYLSAGARFLVYFVSSIPSVVFVALPAAVVAWALSRLVPAETRANIYRASIRPVGLPLAGIVFSVIIIQLLMRKCFLVSNLLLAPSLPAEPPWLMGLLLDDELMPLFFSLLVAVCGVPIAILLALRGTPMPGRAAVFARGLLAFLAAVQLLFLPIIFGILIADKTFARVASLGETPLEAGCDAWLAWEGKEGVTFLVRSQDRRRRSLITLPREKVKKMEITGFDPIIPALFKTQQGSTR
ncbi:MAG: hypothetical protein ACKV2U_27250 [Bryobacteraceae bacterium]